MKLNQLQSFVVIAREQNLTRASELLHLSQSAVSSQIKLLEDELKVSLFKRTSKNMLLTNEGQVLLSHAEKVLKEIDLLNQQATKLSQGASSVAIGLNTDASFLRVSAINERMKLLYADANITFQICPSVDTAQKLRQGQIDLGFFYGAEKQADIGSITLKQIRTCVVIPTKLKSSSEFMEWRDVTALPWVWVDNDFPLFSNLQRSMNDYLTIPTKAVTAVDEHIVRELVISGHGVAIMREDEARPLADQGVVSIWKKGWGDIPLSLGWLLSNQQNDRINNAVDVIKHIWKETPVTEEGSLNDKYWA